MSNRSTIKKRLESVRWRARYGYGREPASVAAAAREPPADWEEPEEPDYYDD